MNKEINAEEGPALPPRRIPTNKGRGNEGNRKSPLGRYHNKYL